MRWHHAGAAAIGLLMAACASSPQISVVTSSAVPSTEARVNAKAQGANTLVTIEVKHMAQPNRIDPGASAYVVWAEPLDTMSGQPQNIGVLSVDKNLDGKLQTLTPLQQFSLFVTAEPSGIVQRPSGERLLVAQVDRSRR